MAKATDKSVSEDVGLSVPEIRAHAEKMRKSLRMWEMAVEVIDSINSRDSVIPGFNTKVQSLKREITIKEKAVAALNGEVETLQGVMAANNTEIENQEKRKNELNAYIAGGFRNTENEMGEEMRKRVAAEEAEKRKVIDELSGEIEVKEKALKGIDAAIAKAMAERGKMLKALA